MSILKPYSCPNCKQKLPIKHLFLLGNNTNVQCKHCHMFSKPEHMNMWYASIGFLSVVVPLEGIKFITGSFVYGISAGLICGFLYYIAILFYVYNNVRFHLL